MELGNLVFGNSRGEFKINRSFYDEIFRPLFTSTYLDQFGDAQFENSTFVVNPYYWGECTCGYDKLEEQANITHTTDCYHYSYLAIKDSLNKHLGDTVITRPLILELYKKHNLEPIDQDDPEIGCAIRCSCDYDKKWEKFHQNNNHKSDCKLLIPNFLHKQSGFSIKWYKYPFRDSYSNMDLTEKQLTSIVADCVKSLKGE